MPKSPPEWRQFFIPRAFARPLDTVSHVTHVHTSLDIIAAGRINPGLVFDKSRLNESRVLVVWLSPNDWSGAGGFRYGNVRFSFDWKSIIRGKLFFWVESIAYRTPACRILMTEADYSGTLKEYDPSTAQGPWIYDSQEDAHFWNGGYCLELMLEDPLYLYHLSHVDFVAHHPDFCSINRSTCKFMGEQTGPASGMFLAGLVSMGLDPAHLALTSTEAGPITPTLTLQLAFTWLRAHILKNTTRGRGDLTPRHAAAAPVMKAIFFALYHRHDDDIRHLSALFASRDSLEASCGTVIADYFHISNREQLEPSWP